MDQGSI